MYSNLKSDEKRRQEVISCLYWSLMQNWNIPQSMQDYFGLTEDYRLYHQLEDMDPAIYRQKRAAGEIPDVLEVECKADHEPWRISSRVSVNALPFLISTN